MLGSIELIQNESSLVEEEIQYVKNFEKPYLESEWAPYYIGHENGVLYDWERVVRLKSKKPLTKDESLPDEILSRQSEDDVIKISSPEESRHYFINDKLTPLKDLWILQ